MDLSAAEHDSWQGHNTVRTGRHQNRCTTSCLVHQYKLPQPQTPPLPKLFSVEMGCSGPWDQGRIHQTLCDLVDNGKSLLHIFFAYLHQSLFLFLDVLTHIDLGCKLTRFIRFEILTESSQGPLFMRTHCVLAHDVWCFLAQLFTRTKLLLLNFQLLRCQRNLGAQPKNVELDSIQQYLHPCCSATHHLTNKAYVSIVLLNLPFKCSSKFSLCFEVENHFSPKRQ